MFRVTHPFAPDSNDYSTDMLPKRYTTETLNARQAQRQAEEIAWAPVVFQVSRAMLKHGVLALLNDAPHGLTEADVADATGLSPYAVKCMLEASLTIGTVLLDPDAERYRISKTGWFLLNDPATRVNVDFNHDVNYIGLHRLDEALETGRPAGLQHFGPWPTVYEGLSQLPQEVQRSWFAFDHFYSDSAFPEALRLVFDTYGVRTLYDVGGNTGKWALACTAYNAHARVTILDLPQQIELMRANVARRPGADRIDGIGINLLDPKAQFPAHTTDAIWMSQFLDCFSEPQAESILRRATQAMGPDTRLFIMETLWDRQRFEPAAFCLAMTSLYFTAIANGNSKMYRSADLLAVIARAGLTVDTIHDNLGQGHSIIVCRK